MYRYVSKSYRQISSFLSVSSTESVIFCAFPVKNRFAEYVTVLLDLDPVPYFNTEPKLDGLL